MKRKIELLAPGGDIDSIKTAILTGADAIYCGLNKFNARNRATNISFEDLQGLIRLAHKNNSLTTLLPRPKENSGAISDENSNSFPIVKPATSAAMLYSPKVSECLSGFAH